MDEDATSKQEPTIKSGLTEDFASVYANNVHFELSAWDLKIICGQLDQSGGGMEVEWHTAVTIPWPVAKIFSYLLRTNIAMYEAGNGTIHVPRSSFPIAPEPPTGEHDTEQNRQFYAYLLRARANLAGSEVSATLDSQPT